MSDTSPQNSLCSMTGFASVSDSWRDISLTVEMKSVNAKGLDVRVRVPSELDGLDLQIKRNLAKQLGRGAVSVMVSMSQENAGALDIDHDALRSLLTAIEPYAADVAAGVVGKASLDGLLQVRGVVRSKDTSLSQDERLQVSEKIMAVCDKTVSELRAARAREGGEIELALREQLTALAVLAAAARKAVGPRASSIAQRYETALGRLEGHSGPVSDERLAQELALIAVKLDVTEELDRLDVHIAEAESLLSSVEPVGRKLDFLCQELHREANTLCSKASDTDLTRFGLDMKLLIDQFREQVQNIE